MKKRIICIGRQKNNDDDTRSLKHIANWLGKRAGYEALAARIGAEDLDIYDMSTAPKKGDGVTALARYRDVEAVVTLHIFGIDFTEGLVRKSPRLVSHGGYLYTRWNHAILDICMRRNLPLIAWGDQPCHHEGSNRIQIVGSAYLYERRKRDLKTIQSADRAVQEGKRKVRYAGRGALSVS